MEHSLAPLCARRDIAMLGLIHKTNIGLAPSFRKYFRVDTATALPNTRRSARRHRFHLEELELRLATTRRSVLGLIPVYNSLPSEAIEANNTKDFQASLQAMLKDLCRRGTERWQRAYSPRLPLYSRIFT